MNSQQWARVKACFDAGLELDPAARAAWRASLAREDADVRHEVEALLHAYEESAGFLDQPLAIDPADLAQESDDHRGPLPPGTRVGDYEIRHEIGRGGMGVIYLAHDVQLTRPAALKALPASTARDPLLLERLRREAQAAAAVSHPGVAMVYAFLDTPHGTFIASEFIQGRTLREELRGGAFDASRALRIAIDITQALAAAHDARVVHRDLKPENVLLTPNDGVKVIDFGIARLDRVDVPALTAPGMLQGTPGYMAPEQLVGGALVDGRADLYAVGIILSEMLLGFHPFERGSRSLPAALDAIARRCLESDPGRRYQSARDLLHDLQRAAARPLDGTAAAGEPGRTPGRGALWWWQFHQGVSALIYWLMAVPAWHARPYVDDAVRRGGRILFFLILGALLLASILRLHLWFISRTAPADLPLQLRQERRWILAADGLLALSLVAGGLVIGERDMSLAVLLLALGVGTWVVSLFVEPSTTRAALRQLPPDARDR